MAGEGVMIRDAGAEEWVGVPGRNIGQGRVGSRARLVGCRRRLMRKQVQDTGSLPFSRRRKKMALKRFDIVPVTKDGCITWIESHNCSGAYMRDYCKWLKRGYGRTNHLCSIDIRNGRMTREKALELEKKYDGKEPISLNWFLKQMGLTEIEFEKIMEKHVIEPHVFTRSLVTGKELPDMGRWL